MKNFHFIPFVFKQISDCQLLSFFSFPEVVRHVVWETLNSEEATYLWHFEKSIDPLRTGLKEIEDILKEIKASNKQNHLSKEHNNFCRVIHDYSDSKSGFIFWKGMMEEKLN